MTSDELRAAVAAFVSNCGTPEWPLSQFVLELMARVADLQDRLAVLEVGAAVGQAIAAEVKP